MKQDDYNKLVKEHQEKKAQIKEELNKSSITVCKVSMCKDQGGGRCRHSTIRKRSPKSLPCNNGRK
jgi:hypothetical protein